jgi:hypothetical protein
MNLISATSPRIAVRPFDTEVPTEEVVTPEGPVLAHAQRITGVGEEADLDHVRRTLRRRAALTPGHLRTLAWDPLHPTIEVSLWRSPLSVRAYAQAGRPDLADLRRRGRPAALSVERVLWWVTDDEAPAPSEAVARLEHLRRHGPGPEGFTLRSPVPAPAHPGR